VPEAAPVEPPPAPTGAAEEEGGALSPTLAIYCLGLFQVYHDDQLITDWHSLKGLAILKYLIAHHGTTITKDTLMDVFWPNADAEAARRNLHQALYSLRQVLKQGHPDFQHILFENDCYLLNPELRIWIDYQEFEMRVETCRRLERAGAGAAAMTEYSIAESLYQGDFLEEDPYEDWPQQQREHLRNLYLDVADRLTAYLVEHGDYVAVIALCQKILSCDHYHEEAYRRLMQCYIARGQRHLAIRQYQMCVKALGELELTPTEETVALYNYLLTNQ
jgi:DNA-binding SARP family transcriptional activator